MLKKKQLTLLMTIAMMLLIIATTVHILNTRASIFKYDVTDDYIFNVDTTMANLVKLQLKEGKIDLPEIDQDEHQTVLLKVNIKSTILGHYLQPSIDLIGGEKTVTQYVEYGAEGIRYLNISALNLKNIATIRLEGKHLSMEDQTVQRVLFKNRNPKESKILIIAPHPDDAEIAAYGLYSANRNTYIITVTAGDAGNHKYNEIYPDRAEHFIKKGELRTWNSITVPLLGGIPFEQTINLGFFDGTLKSMYNEKSKPATGRYINTSDISTFRKQNVSSLSAGLGGSADWNSLVNNLEYLLKEIAPDVIVTPYPALDNHTDHKFTTIALFEAITKTGMTNGQLYLYTNHLVHSEYYPCGNMHGVVSVPPNLGAPIFCDSIYSHGLTMSNQKDKIFALEAMNDLRLDTKWRFSESNIKMAIRNITRDLTGIDYSYFRRAVRSNELFFVADIVHIYNEEIRNKIIGPI